MFIQTKLSLLISDLNAILGKNDYISRVSHDPFTGTSQKKGTFYFINGLKLISIINTSSNLINIVKDPKSHKKSSSLEERLINVFQIAGHIGQNIPCYTLITSNEKSESTHPLYAVSELHQLGKNLEKINNKIP